MRPDIESVTAKIAAIHARLDRAPERIADQEIEDALCDGYTLALTADAWLTERSQQLQQLLDDSSTAVRGRELRELAGDHAVVRRSLLNLRAELEGLRQVRDRLLDHAVDRGLADA